MSYEADARVQDSLAATIEMVIEKYHRKHDRQLDDILDRAHALVAHDSDREAAREKINVLIRDMALTLRQHMQKEERILFPALLAGATNLECAISAMRFDHDDIESRMVQIADLIDQFKSEDLSNPSEIALREAVAELSQDLKEHVHIENNVLFTESSISETSD